MTPYGIDSPYFFPRGQGQLIIYKFSCTGPSHRIPKKTNVGAGCWCKMLVQDKIRRVEKNILGTFDPHEHVNDRIL